MVPNVDPQFLFSNISFSSSETDSFLIAINRRHYIHSGLQVSNQAGIVAAAWHLKNCHPLRLGTRSNLIPTRLGIRLLWKRELREVLHISKIVAVHRVLELVDQLGLNPTAAE